MPKEKALTTGQVANYCHVSYLTVLKWIREGDLKAYQLPSGHHRIPETGFREFLEQQRMPVDEAFFGETGKDSKTILDEEPLTTGQVADYCHVAHVTVLKWIKEGNLKAYRIPSGHHRVLKSDLKKFLEDNEMPVDEAFFD
jgi:excisionase family DNA binding protein